MSMGNFASVPDIVEYASTSGGCVCVWGERVGVGAAYADGQGDKLEEAPGLITALRHRLLIGRLGPADCSPPA